MNLKSLKPGWLDKMVAEQAADEKANLHRSRRDKRKLKEIKRKNSKLAPVYTTYCSSIDVNDLRYGAP
jgi:hypothetical protein